MIDFSSCEIDPLRAYGGANGKKIHIRYQGAGYMLKFPPAPTINKAMSYTNSCISEYIACHIYASIGIPVQETLLGTYTDRRGIQRVVVACRDFTEGGKRLIEFAQVKNTCINSENNGYGTELSSILESIEEQNMLGPKEMLSFFWDMFIVDALVGNFDRHNGNWGVLVDERERTVQTAPIYDCGSCLYPQLAETEMGRVLESEAEKDNRIFVFPTSAIKENGRKLNYFDYISSLQNADCIEALARILPRIHLQDISRMIDKTPFISPVQKTFYKRMVTERKEKILDYSMEKLLRLERKSCQPESDIDLWSR